VSRSNRVETIDGDLTEGNSNVLDDNICFLFGLWDL
jgi:hypothetical protein